MKIPFCAFRGHVLVIVNVASNCGYTKKDYPQLVELDEKYRDSKGLRILAFPCNQFGKQVMSKLKSLFFQVMCSSLSTTVFWWM